MGIVVGWRPCVVGAVLPLVLAGCGVSGEGPTTDAEWRETCRGYEQAAAQMFNDRGYLAAYTRGRVEWCRGQGYL